MIRAEGKALLPGLFDLHTHWTPSGAPATTPQIAAAYLRSGITSVNDFHQAPESYLPRREWLSRLATPHVSFAARVSTPGGHGADWGDQSTTVWINTPAAARAAVKGLLVYKPDLIKGFADGWRYGTAPDNTSMDEGTLRALAEEAHANGLEVLTHTVTVDRGRAAARAGVDSLAHSMQDRKLDAAAVAEIKRLGMAVIPTLAVYEPQRPGSAPRDRTDPKVAQSFAKFDNALYNAKVLFEAGVPIGVGTDAGMPDTPHGASTLRELELLVRAGLTPAQALVAATSVSARIMHDDTDRGTIAAGKRADIVLIDGKPWEDIGAIHRINSVLVDGRVVVGKGAPPLPGQSAPDRLPSTKVAALIDDFERADQRTSLGTLRVETPDGGMDRTLEISQVVPREGDAQGDKALLISAHMAQKDDVYAGIAIPLTRGSVQPVDVRGYKGVRFEVKGEGAYTLRVNGIDGRWTRGFSATPGWTSIKVPFSELAAEATRKGPGPRWSGDGITQVEFGASREPGERVWLQIDNVTFY
ncbi:amidohydrolase family protein [Novosphingobium gossypii]|uniref:amidohydrolase family protein n=1 Tax=Novosphingobium gossypii TaxID=1604774 RepID=UPI003D240E50